MKIELTDDERTLLLVALGMAMAASGKDPDIVRGIRVLIGKIAPTSYWGVRSEES